MHTVSSASPSEAHDLGAVVHRYTDGLAFEVEFVTGEGETIAVLTLTPDDIRPIGRTRSSTSARLAPA